MGMGHNVLYLSGIFITLVVFSSGSDINNAENKIIVENNAKDVGIHCVINRDDLPQSDSESKGLYMCPTMRQCRNERRDRFIIARIENNTIFNYYPKEYKVSMNGTLTVRKMSSKYDGMVVWCILMVPLIGAGENTTVIQIAQERPKLNINSPQLFAVVQGMTLHLDFDATGYPSPRVIWFRDEQVLQNRSIEESTSLVLRNVTKNDEGKYNCTATNLLGSDSYEVQVNVIGEF
ncbi:vascular endothelial growth factor receptor 1-like isoform X1 [Pocillopora damicornis]|uniref:vascular endothelial growth factor receptor 1-like isoform X1 n=1 Tax=Pocillopora damicornis TaxID=46731 RepID=UPI000F5586C2|nr:vascular endothelial growth factor receptor 1-like isoform X1 [Pocillopora damicornis]